MIRNAEYVVCATLVLGACAHGPKTEGRRDDFPILAVSTRVLKVGSQEESALWKIAGLCVEEHDLLADDETTGRSSNRDEVNDEGPPPLALHCIAPVKGESHPKIPWTPRVSGARTLDLESPEDLPVHGDLRDEVVFVYQGKREGRVSFYMLAEYQDLRSERYRILFRVDLSIERKVYGGTPTLYFSNRSLKPYCGWEGTSELKQGDVTVATADIAPREFPSVIIADRAKDEGASGLDRIDSCWRLIPIPLRDNE